VTTKSQRFDSFLTRVASKRLGGWQMYQAGKAVVPVVPGSLIVLGETPDVERTRRDAKAPDVALLVPSHM